MHADRMLPAIRRAAAVPDGVTDAAAAAAVVDVTSSAAAIVIRGRAVHLAGIGDGDASNSRAAVARAPPGPGAVMVASSSDGSSSSSEAAEGGCVRVLDAGPAVLTRCRGKLLSDHEKSLRSRPTIPVLHCDRPVVAWDAPIEGGVRTGKFGRV